MTYKFDDEEGLGKAVKQMKPFCKLTKTMDIPTEKEIVGDFSNPHDFPGLAGKKWSRLCGFTFMSNDGRMFQFVFVPKLRNSLTRNNAGLSGWYCWSVSPYDDTKEVTSITAMKNRYGFDVNKFVHSDVFDKYVKMFKSNVKYALDNQVKDLLLQQPASNFTDYKELVRYVNAVKDSISRIEEVKQFVTPDNKYDDSNAPDYARGSAPKVGHAKIAYNADKTYALKNIDKDSQKRMAVDKLVQNTQQGE